MKYVEVCKALYDYEARTPDEITIHEDDILYVVEKEDDDWWRAELKVNGEPGPTGLVPATYLTECEPIGQVEAEYDYTAQHEEELTFAEGDIMLVLERDDPDWLLVKMEKTGEIGLAPGNYVRDIHGHEQAPAALHQQREQEEEEHYEDAVSSPQYEEPGPQVATASASAGAAALTAGAAATAASASSPVSATSSPSIVTSPIVTPVNAHATGTRDIGPDDAQSWTVHDYDPAKKKKKKSKGNLLVGNGMICYGSETDKTLPVQQYSILDVTKYLFDGKNLHIEIAGPRPTTLDLQAASKSEAKAILVKITDSRNIAQRAATQIRSPVEGHADESDFYHQNQQQQKQHQEREQPEMPPRPAPAPAAPACEPRWGFVSYNFTAEAGDEIDVQENEQVLVIDYVRDDGWWQIEKTDGRQGIVPSSYVQLNEDYDDTERKREEEERQRKEQLEREEQERQRQREAEEEERRRQEEAQRREEEERRKKLQEAARRAELARQRQIEEENRKRAEAERRRSANLQRTATLPSQGSESRASGLSRSQSVSARNQDLPKPDMSKVRTWTDRSGAFKVDAQFLAFYDGKFRLHKTNGVKIDVPVEKMSLEDVRWVENQIGRSVTKTASAIPEDEPTPPMPPRPQPASTAAGPSSSKPVKEKKVNPNWDWFDWFMMIGIPMQPALIYASAFKADKLDDSDIPNLTHKRMKMLGVKEKHVQRIERYIETEEPEPPSDNEDEEQEEQQQTKEPPSKRDNQLESDEELARRLHREWNGQEAPKPSRPKPSKSAPKEIHPDLLEFIGTQFTADTPSSDKATAKETVPAAPPDNLIGFEDDAWTPREESKQVPTAIAVAKQPQSPLQPVQAAPTGASQTAPQPATVTPPPPAAPTTLAVPQQQQPLQPLAQAQAQQAQLQQQQQPQVQVSMPPRQRPVSTLKHMADPTLSHWQQQSSTGQSQSPISTGQVQGQSTGGVQIQQPSLQMLQQQQQQQQQQQVPMQTGQQMNVFSSAPQTQVYSQPTSNTMNAQYSSPQQQMIQPTGQSFMQQQQPQWQQLPIQAQMTGFQAPQQQQQQQPQVTGFQQQQSTHVPMQTQMTGFQQPQQQMFSVYQHQQPQPQQQPSWQGAMSGYQQPIATSQVPLSSVLPQPLIPAPNQQRASFANPQMGLSAQPTGMRNWQSATPDNPFGSPLDNVAPLSPQRTGVQFSTPNSNMFTQSPLQGQPTVYLQPQMTGVPNNGPDPMDRYAAFKNTSTISQPSIFTPAGSMAYAQSSFQKERRW